MKRFSTVFVMLAAFCWGISGGIGGVLITAGWSPFVVSFYRGSVGFFFVLLWLILRPKGSGLKNPRVWVWSAIAGLGVAGNFSFYFVSISHGSVAIAATLMYCAPVFVYLLSFVLKFERPTMPKWIAIAVVLAGIVLLTQIYNAEAASVTVIGIGAGLLSGLCYVLFIFGFKYAAPHGSPQAILTIAFAVLAAVLIWPGQLDEYFTVVTSPDLSYFIGLGLLGAGISFILYIIGIHFTLPAVASIVAMVEPVTASLFSVLVLGETLAVMQILGMVLILLAVTALSVYSNTGRKSSYMV